MTEKKTRVVCLLYKNQNTSTVLTSMKISTPLKMAWQHAKLNVSDKKTYLIW